MTQSKFLERVARLGPTQVEIIDRVSGSPAVVHLICHDRGLVRTATAARELARRGPTLLRAKRAVEAALQHGSVAILLSDIEDREVFARVIADAGLDVRFMAEGPVDVRALREQLALTREQFAWHFNLPVDTVEKWETGERQPDAGALAFLRVIARDPKIAMAAQEV